MLCIAVRSANGYTSHLHYATSVGFSQNNWGQMSKCLKLCSGIEI